MSNQEPRDLVSNLAETLGAEHEELNQEKTAEVIAHLERVIANVPPATEFTNTRKYVVLGPLLNDAAANLQLQFGNHLELQLETPELELSLIHI